MRRRRRTGRRLDLLGPRAIAAYAALGVPDGPAGTSANRARRSHRPATRRSAPPSTRSIPGFIEGALGPRAASTTWERDHRRARNNAVGAGCARTHRRSATTSAPSPNRSVGRGRRAPGVGPCPVRAPPRVDPARRPVVSAWLAPNCIREWRGDTHFAVLLAEGLTGTQAGLLHDAYMNYPGQWIPRSRGADDVAIASAPMTELERRGLAPTGAVNAGGIALRERIEGPPTRCASCRGGPSASRTPRGSSTCSSRSGTASWPGSTPPPGRNGCPPLGTDARRSSAVAHHP